MWYKKHAHLKTKHRWISGTNARHPLRDEIRSCLIKCLLCWCIFNFSLSQFSILFDTWWWFWGLGWEQSSAGTVGDGNDCCGDGDESYGDGDNVENSSGGGMGMGMTGVGTVGDGDKYLSPCSSLLQRCLWVGCMAIRAWLRWLGTSQDMPRGW